MYPCNLANCGEMEVVGRWKCKSRWREGVVGMNEESVCVITQLGTNLKVSKASHNFVCGVVMVARILEDIGAGVAKIMCLKGPKVVSFEIEGSSECKV